MSTGASLWFNEPLESEIRNLWSDLAAAGISDGLHAGPYRPHLTLGVWDSLDPGPLAGVLREALKTEIGPEVRFEAIGVFPGKHGVVYLTPGVTDALSLIRNRVKAAALELGGRPATWLPSGPWFPHCTLAWELTAAQLLDAVRRLLPVELPLTGRAVALGIVDTPAEVELERIPLGL